jgi:ParB family transcriptional regulator, chromosome partitioning protein
VSLPRISIDKLRPNRANPSSRLSVDDELAASILALGTLLQPLVVQQGEGGTWLILDGHRRYAAAKSVGVQSLPCLAVRPGGEDAQVATILAASMHKRLEPLEQARLFRKLRGSMDVRTIAARTGFSARTVSDRLALLYLPAEVQEKVEAKEVTASDGATLGRQLEKAGTGTVSVRPPTRSRWLTRTHPLAATVSEACTHLDTRAAVGIVGCGQCWEAAIRTDERSQLAASRLVADGHACDTCDGFDPTECPERDA